jgi:hypothetical protein
VGTIRVALDQGIKPSRFAFGAAAALAVLDRRTLETNTPLATWLDPLWHVAAPDAQEKERVLELIEEGRHRLRRWRDSGFQNLEDLFGREG